jgi:predicted nucleic acid-binding protein
LAFASPESRDRLERSTEIDRGFLEDLLADLVTPNESRRLLFVDAGFGRPLSAVEGVDQIEAGPGDTCFGLLLFCSERVQNQAQALIERKPRRSHVTVERCCLLWRRIEREAERRLSRHARHLGSATTNAAFATTAIVSTPSACGRCGRNRRRNAYRSLVRNRETGAHVALGAWAAPRPLSTFGCARQCHTTCSFEKPITTPSRSAVIDSSVYVELFRYGHFRDELAELPYLVRSSAVVLAELRRGASLPRERKWIDELEANHRVFFPGLTEWRKSGEILAKLRVKKHYDARKLRDLHFDTLTALVARAVGATVITCDGDDFENIRGFAPFDLVVWRPPRARR